MTAELSVKIPIQVALTRKTMDHVDAAASEIQDSANDGHVGGTLDGDRDRVRHH